PVGPALSAVLGRCQRDVVATLALTGPVLAVVVAGVERAVFGHIAPRLPLRSGLAAAVGRLRHYPGGAPGGPSVAGRGHHYVLVVVCARLDRNTERRVRGARPAVTEVRPESGELPGRGVDAQGRVVVHAVAVGREALPKQRATRDVVARHREGLESEVLPHLDGLAPGVTPIGGLDQQLLGHAESLGRIL